MLRSLNQMNFPQEEEEEDEFNVLPLQQQAHDHHFEVLTRIVKLDDPGFGSCPLGENGSGFEMNYPMVAAMSEITRRDSTSPEKRLNSSAVGRESSFNKKRKYENYNNIKAVAVGEDDEMRSKKLKAQNTTDDGESITTSKVSEVGNKPDYIHVRARRGQATDSHSLAERVRREKISERMKYLQDLVPGCNKITGKAGMLDEIINYVQSLQKQVEFLSMKLAAVHPTLDFNAAEDRFFTEQAIQASTEMGNNPPYLMFNPLQPVVSCPDSEALLQRSTSPPPMAIPELYLNSLCFNQILPSSTWDANLQNFYPMEEFLQEKSTLFSSSQQYTGSIEAGSMKIEM